MPIATCRTTRFVADMKAGVTEVKRRVPGKKVAAMGFCFGGGTVWTLLAANAALDSRVSASRPAAEAALRAAGLPHQLVTVPGVDHAFFNDTGGRYDRAAADAA